MKLQEAYLFYSNKLAEISIHNPSNETRIIIKYVLDIQDIDFIINSHILLTEHQVNSLQEIFIKRIQGIPLAYILNSQFFWKHDFYVNENVLIPRQDTETLVETFLKYFPDKKKSLNILEIGVGSGCLILSVLDQYKNSQGIGIDISLDALNIAHVNAKNLDLEDRICLVQSDLFDRVHGKFDVIISNPPYIDEQDDEIADDVKLFEPHIALFAKNNGLFFYEEILKNAKKYFNKDGLIFFEIGYKQSKDVLNIAMFYGFFHVETCKDLSNKDRVIVLKMES